MVNIIFPMQPNYGLKLVVNLILVQFPQLRASDPAGSYDIG